ncbi:MAG: bifunctional adenosylcobinamide kinase/adenosylcobinamide-phosphate guanylyltransferase [Actinomycetota bacterium]|nr:bifunctional adenosylcobinamide kinase/adenosylcobinamide-phosphate guanylyltransferase [Actinomycetota bacterium]
MHKIYFLLGGARSGKSSYAEELASSIPGRVAYLATAKITDSEMEKRVEIHRMRRPGGWKTIELKDKFLKPGKLKELNLEGTEVLIVDCITNLLYRLLEDHQLDQLSIIPNQVEQKIEQEVSDYFDYFCTYIKTIKADVILVSNEVGMGLVPPYPLGRVFRDLMGTINKQLALVADEAYFFIAGTRQRLK